jgi:hypothetical protein
VAYLLGFGRYRDKTLEWVFFNDPGYVWWMVKEGATKNLKGATQARFNQIVKRAKRLAVPGNCKHCKRSITRMSLTEHTSGGLAGVDFFCDQCDLGSPRSVLVTPSFYTPDFFRSYDKLGGTFLVAAIKRAYFGPRVRLTQAKMEEFFDTPGNFVDP